MKNKLSLGSWINPGFRTLHHMRRTRGTRLDVFGYHPIRRMERALVYEYRHVVGSLLQELDSENHAIAVEIARLPDMIRGYEQVKAGNVKIYPEVLGAKLSAFHGQGQPAQQTG